MKRAALILGALAALGASSLWAGTATIDNSTQYQTIDGFGAASVWNSGQISAALAKTFWTDESSLAPASMTNGNCGLSIERMLIDPAESWASEAASAQLAVQTNPNIIVFGSAWSPPTAYKQNGKTSGNNTGNSNFNPGSNTNVFVSSAANYTGYANHLVNFVKALKSSYGVNIYAVSPQNEPDYDTSYDSCLWTAQQFHDLIGTYLGPALKTAGLNTKIMTPESFADNQAGSNTTMNDTAVAPYVGIIGMHLYGGGPTALPASYATNAGHAVSQWVTEISDFATNDPSMTNGMKYAQQIHTCIVDKAFNGYCFWWLINQNSDNEGLCDNTKTPTKKLYVMGNFAKFIRPGFMRIAATEAPSSGIQVSAYCNTATAKAVIVAINSSGSSVSQAFSLGGSLNVATVYPWITDSSRNLVQQASQAVSGGSFTYTLPSMSVVTFLCPITGSSSSPTFTITPSRTPTATSTRTNAPASTFTSTATPSSSATSASTFTRTSTATSTGIASPTQSFTERPTGSATNTPTSSATSVDTFTRTVTPTRTATATPSSTSEPSSTPSFTELPTGSATRTPTASPTFRDTPSSTATAEPSGTSSSTATDSPSSTRTWTPSSTASTTGTASATASPSSTPSSSSTLTGTPNPSPTASPSITTTPQARPGLAVLKLVPVPNPNPGEVMVELSGPADEGWLRVWSASLRLLDQEPTGALRPGWASLALPKPLLHSLANGVYFITFTARRGQFQASSRVIKMMILR